MDEQCESIIQTLEDTIMSCVFDFGVYTPWVQKWMDGTTEVPFRDIQQDERPNHCEGLTTKEKEMGALH